MFSKEEILSARFYKHPYNRIFDRVKKSSNGCLEFQGGLDIHGYGKIKIKGHNMGVHKVAYILCKGDIPAGMVVMHSCDNPKCVNPDHLSIGTIKDNVHDCISKGRFKGGYNSGSSARRMVAGSSSNCFLFFADIYIAEQFGFKNGGVSKSFSTGKPYKGFNFTLISR